MRALLAATVAAVALVAAYLVLGGGDFEPTRAPDACTLPAQPAPAAGGDALTGMLERVGLNALATSACDLGVTRERLLLALGGEADIGVDGPRRTAAFRAGLGRAIDEEERAGRVSPAQAFLLRQAIAVLPMDAVLDRLFGEGL
jgi:hypothetical protein